MIFLETSIKGLYIIEPTPNYDERGWFSRVYCQKEFLQISNDEIFVQINHSFNVKKGTFRGFHYQIFPSCEQKLIRCISGSALDIVIDLRRGSETFLKNIHVKITKNNKMIFVPKGCAHGFLTLEDNTELLYHHTAFYEQRSERGIRYDDPMLNISLKEKINIISKKDLEYPMLPKDFTGLET